MQLLFTGPPSAVIQAFCQVLIHSLWQGCAAGVVAALIVSCTRRSRAVLRYNLLLAVLLLFVSGIGITTAVEFRHSYANTNTLPRHTLTGLYSPPNPGKAGNDFPGDLVTQNVFERLNTWFNEHASIVVLLWFCLFLVKCSQAVAGFRYMHRIRHRNNYEVTSSWKERLHELAQKTGITSSIIFLESELIKIPAVIGHLKPVLLDPSVCFATFPPNRWKLFFCMKSHIFVGATF